MTYRRVLLATVAAFAFGSPAFAQTAPAVPQNDETAQIDDVVVTAERSQGSAQRTPISIAVVSGETLDRQGVRDTRDLSTTVPGLAITQATSNPNLGLRGLSSGGGNQYADPSVAFNLNGVTLARPYGALAPFFDVARVEVLKGPQGTLYGRNAAVGALNVITNDPRSEFQGALSAGVGNYDLRELSGMLNLPITDRLAVRGAFQTIQRDGYLSNGLNDADNQGVRLSAKYNASDALTIKGIFDYFHDGSKGAGTVFLYPNGFSGSRYLTDDPWTTYSPAPCSNPSMCPTLGQSSFPVPFVPTLAGRSAISPDAYNDTTTKLYSLEMNWDTPLGTVTILPAHVDTSIHYLSVGQGLEQTGDFEVDQDTVEVRLGSMIGDRFKSVIGGYYFKESQTGAATFVSSRGITVVGSAPLVDENYAIFGQGTYNLTPSLRTTLGLRYTHEEKTQNGTATGTPADSNPATPACTPASLAAGAVELPIGPNTPVGGCQFLSVGDVTYEDTSFRVGIEYDLAPDSLIYANVSSAFKAGGFFIGLAPNTYEPEKLTAYQIGTKNRFFDRRVQANIELFYWDYKDQQIAVFSALNPPQLTATRPFNVPGWIYGADMDFSWLVTDHDRLNLQVLYAKGEYETFPTAASAGRITGGLTDAPRANLPEFSATLGYVRTWDLNNGAVITFGARTHYESPTYLNPNRIAGSRRDAYFNSDLDLTFEAPNSDWKITAFARNLENADIALTGTSGIIGPGIAFRPAGNTNSPYVGLAPPRTFGVRVSKSF